VPTARDLLPTRAAQPATGADRPTSPATRTIWRYRSRPAFAPRAYPTRKEAAIPIRSFTAPLCPDTEGRALCPVGGGAPANVLTHAAPPAWWGGGLFRGSSIGRAS